MLTKWSKSLIAGLLCASPAGAEQWWSVPIGIDRGGVQAAFVESQSISDSASGKYAWIVETFLSDQSPYSMKKEQVDVDCSQARYRGLRWYWTDRHGQVTMDDTEDLRWNVIFSGTPMEALRVFVCFGPPAGSAKVQAIGG